MSLKKCGVVVSCEHCEYQSQDSRGGFEVTVPLTDTETDVGGTARLHCMVGSGQHQVELSTWMDDAGQPLDPPPDTAQRVAEAIGSVARHRVCGSRQICPSEVVRVVKENC